MQFSFSKEVLQNQEGQKSMSIELKRKEEAAYFALMEAKGRCDECGHLNEMHNEHCCSFCKVPECPCRFGQLPLEGDEPNPENRWSDFNPKGETK